MNNAAVDVHVLVTTVHMNERFHFPWANTEQWVCMGDPVFDLSRNFQTVFHSGRIIYIATSNV